MTPSRLNFRLEAQAADYGFFLERGDALAPNAVARSRNRSRARIARTTDVLRDQRIDHHRHPELLQFFAQRAIVGRDHDNEDAVLTAPARGVEEHHRRAGKREIVRDEKEIGRGATAAGSFRAVIRIGVGESR